MVGLNKSAPLQKHNFLLKDYLTALDSDKFLGSLLSKSPGIYRYLRNSQTFDLSITNQNEIFFISVSLKS